MAQQGAGSEKRAVVGAQIQSTSARKGVKNDDGGPMRVPTASSWPEGENSMLWIHLPAWSATLR